MVGAAMFDVCLQCIDDDFLCARSIIYCALFDFWTFLLMSSSSGLSCEEKKREDTADLKEGERRFLRL